LNNKTLPKTHVVELINDLLRNRTKTSSPTGWKQLVNALKGHNIPRELIGNSERWKYINSPQDRMKKAAPLQPTSHRRRKTALTWEFDWKSRISMFYL